MNKKYIKKSAFLAMAISAVLMSSTTNVYADSTEDRLSKLEALVETKAAQSAFDSLVPKVAGKAEKTYVDDELKKKANQSDLEALQEKVEKKAEQSEVDTLKEKVEKKADKSYVDDELKKKADKSQVDALEQKVEKKVDQSKFDEYTRNTNTTLAGLARDKANKEYVDDELKKKADKSYVDTELNKKANKSQVDALEQKVEKKADKTYVDDELKKKADKSYVDTELNKKANKSQVDALEQKVEKKADKTYVDGELKKKADKSELEKETKERKEADAQLASNVNELQGEIKSVASMSAALAALKPLSYNPNAPLQIMAGYGNYRGKSATALGLAYYKNENNLFHMGVSYAGNKNVAANAGVTWSIGSGVSRSMHTDAVTNAELMALQNKVHQFEERDQMQQEMIESMQKQIAELTEMMMMNK